MFRFDTTLAAACLALFPIWAAAGELPENTGTPLGPDDLQGMFSYAPGAGDLPDGSGTVAQGQALYADRCSYCHGEELEGILETGGSRLVGGQGSLSTDAPVKTVESYWPHAETLFDYIKRAMPFDQPGSLSDDETYALTAFILNRGGVLPDDSTLDAASLAQVEMPNAGGFYRGDSYDLRLSQRWADE